MKSCSSTLLTLLNNASGLCLAELFVITLTNGSVFRFTSLPYTFKCGDYNYTSLPIDSGELKQSLGTSVDDFTMKIYYSEEDTLTIGNVDFTIPKALRSGAFDYAVCEYYQVFMETWELEVSEDYRILLFAGRIETETAGRSAAELKVEAFTSILTTKAPPNVYQAGCISSLFGYCCGLDEDDWSTTVKILAGSTKSILYISVAKAAGYYNSGYVEFTSGDNYGIQKTIKSHTYDSSTGIATITLMWKLDSTPSVGDKLKLVPGCDHTMSTCKSKFSNYDNYRGTPYIPVPTITA